jgi:8-oxo-dGTP diphosphatase
VTLPEPARFCPRCGAPLDEANACRVDGYRWHPDPKVAVGALIEADGHLLLVQRNHDPGYGRWAFPSGFVDAGEVLEEAAAREVLEETGVEVTIERLIGAWSEPSSAVVFLAYAGSVTGGEAVAGDEALAVDWFPLDALPPLAFSHDGEIVETWRSGAGAPVRSGRETSS